MSCKIGLLIIVSFILILILQLYNLLDLVFKDTIFVQMLSDQVITMITLIIILIPIVEIGIKIYRSEDCTTVSLFELLLHLESFIALGKALMIVSIINILYTLVTTVLLLTVDILNKVTYIIMWVIILIVSSSLYFYLRRLLEHY